MISVMPEDENTPKSDADAAAVAKVVHPVVDGETPDGTGPVKIDPLPAGELVEYARTVEGLPEIEKRLALMTAAYTQLRLHVGEVGRAYASVKDNYAGGRIAGLNEPIMEACRAVYDCRRLLGDDRTHEQIRGGDAE